MIVDISATVVTRLTVGTRVLWRRLGIAGTVAALDLEWDGSRLLVYGCTVSWDPASGRHDDNLSIAEFDQLVVIG